MAGRLPGALSSMARWNRNEQARTGFEIDQTTDQNAAHASLPYGPVKGQFASLRGVCRPVSAAVRMNPRGLCCSSTLLLRIQAKAVP